MSDNLPLLDHGKTKKSKMTSENDINYGYLSFLLFTVSLGTFQFGYSIGSWNTATNAYAKSHGWDEIRKTKE